MNPTTAASELEDGAEGQFSGRTGSATLLLRLKEIGVHTVIYGVGSALQTALGFILIPLYTRAYSTQLYGVLTLILLVGTFAGAVFYLGISSALPRSYFDYADAADRRRVFSTSLYLTILGGVLEVALGVFGGAALSRALFGTPRYGGLIALALFSSALTSVNAVFFVLLRLERRSTDVILLNILGFLAAAGFIVYLLSVRHLGITAPILGTCISQALLCVALIYQSRHSLMAAWSAHEVAVQLRFGAASALIGLTYYGLDSIDRFFIRAYGSLRDVGIYSLGYKLGMLIEVMLVIPFAQIWVPMAMEYRDEPDAPILFRLMLTYYAIAGMLVAALLSVFAREIVHVGAGPEYQAAYRVVPFVVLGHLAYGAINLVNSGIIFSRRVWYLFLVFLGGLLLNVALNMAWIPRLGYIAAAYVTLVSYAVVVAAVGAVANRWYHVRWDYSRLARVLGTGIMAISVGMAVDAGRVAHAALVKTLVIGLLVVVWYWAVLEERERRGFRRLLATAATVRHHGRRVP